MRSSRPSLLVALLVAVAVLTACSSSADTSSLGQPGGASADAALRVVATTSVLADFAQQVGGDRVDVYTVIKANVDAHDFEPAPADLDAIARADVVLQNGVGLEAWFDRTIEAAQTDGAIVDVSSGVEVREGSGDDHGRDPHIWQSPANAQIMVTNIERAFVEADPDGAADYADAAETYRQVLGELDAWVEQRLEGLTNRKIVTNHDALGYFIDRYHLEFVGSIIPSFDSTAELSATGIDTIVARIREQGVRAVFSEVSIPPKTAERIGAEAGVTVVAGEDALYGDALGPPGSDAATYVDMIRHNTEVLVANLS